jgi:uncharacterized protein YdeI (YjbR/CyaY-like superfamily)
MTSKALPTDFPIQSFTSQSDFASYLEDNHSTAPGIYVKFAKKGSGIPSILGPEAVETALCYGWIDGRANSIDEAWWTVRFTPRRAKSIWSQKNVNTIERLTAEGRMKPAGLAQVQAAKSDGRWEKAYAGPASVTVPADFEAALKANGKAWTQFEGLSKTRRYSYLHRLMTISDKGRGKRIADYVQELAAGDEGDEEMMAEAKEVTRSKKGKGNALPKLESKKAVTTRKSATKKEPETSTTLEKTIVVPRRAGLRART